MISPEEARRLIDHGWRLWGRHPKARQVIWREGRRWYRLTGTTFRVLLDWRPYRKPCDWRPTGYCRWH